VTNRILEDLVAALAPRFAEVTGAFFVRGGITTAVVARHGTPPAVLQDLLAAPISGPSDL